MSKMKMTIFLILLAALTLGGCNFPTFESEPTESSDDRMATEIAKILTGTPVQILISPTTQGATPSADVTPTETVAVIVEEPTPTPTMTFTLIPTGETTTPTPTGTAEPSPTATLSENDPALTLGNPDWIDTMDDGDNWPTGVNEYTTIDFENGYLKLTAEKDVDGWRLSWPFLENFYLESKMQTPDCTGTDHYGLMFRVPANANANKGYLFGITCDGKYSLRRWDGTTMHTPIGWTAHEAINKGENSLNKLGIWADGASLALYINGEKVDDLQDNNFPEGSFGIFVGKDNTDDLTVWVDEIRYWLIP
jgi:hypothetical protein